MKISQSQIVRIRDLNPIGEVIGSYIPLKRAGKNFKALCPFHEEKTPSFFISPDKGLYHCFGCGKSGNVFNFVMEYNKLTFSQAVQLLGDRVGIRIEGIEDANEHLYKANEFAANLYHSTLKTPIGLPGRKWFESRGIREDIVDKFMLGYASAESMICKKILGENIAAFESVGLVKRAENGKYYDTFRSKVIFPIRERWGKIIGFGTRVLDQHEPKYINSPDSAVFKKGNWVYGIYETREHLKEEAILVEGYTDLISLYQSGIRNTVASLGTSLTIQQARLLKLCVPKVIIAYDGDSAGRMATERAINVLLEAGLDTYVLRLPDGEDPDSFVQKNGNLDFSGVQDFATSKLKECKSVDEKASLVSDFQHTLSKISDPVKRELWTHWVSKELGISKELLLITKPTPSRSAGSIQRKNLEDLEIRLIALVANYPKLRESFLKFDPSTQELRSINRLVLEGINGSDIMGYIPNERLRMGFAEISFLKDIEPEKMAIDYLKRIQELKVRTKKEDLRKAVAKEGWTHEHLVQYQRLVNLKTIDTPESSTHSKGD